MHRLGRLLAAAGIIAGALAAVSTAAMTAGASPASAAGGSGCTGYNVGGQGWAVQCGNGGGSDGGGSGGSGTNVCTYLTLQQAEAQFLISAAVAAQYKAPAGYIYLVQNCPDQFFGTPPITLYADGGRLTPQVLANQAYGELKPPALAIATAPIGREGLVGLPEWFWLSTNSATEFEPMSVTVGPIAGVWATVTATPGPLVINPGDGQGPVTCPVPGTPYNTSEPAASQQSACTVLYSRPSAGQPGNVFRVTISVTWTASWVGSGGTGGTLAPITRRATIGLPIAQAETVYTGG